MSGHLDGPPPGPPDPPYIPGDLGAPSAEEFARRRASPTPEERNPYAPSADWKPGQDTFTSQAAGIWAEGFAAGRAAATPDTRSKIHGTGNVPAPDRWLALDRRSGRVAGLPTVEVVAAEDYDREVNDLRDQVQMYEEKAERDWRDFGEMQDARIAADDRVAALDDLVQRAWSLIAGAMSGNPHKPTANSEWMDAAHAWEIDYCMGAGLSGKTNDEKTEPAPFFTEQQERALARCEGYDEGCAATPPGERSVSYRVRDRDSDYKAMCHENRDHAELLLKAWLADGRDAVIESRIVYDAGWHLLASSTAEKLAAPRKRSASASDPMPLCGCELCALPLRDHDEEETR